MNDARHMGPALNRAVLDAATVEALFDDLAACTTILEIQVKAGAHDHARCDGYRLEDVRRQIQERQVRGVQIRYRWQDQEWCDTLLVTDRGVRLVRMGNEAPWSAD